MSGPQLDGKPIISRVGDNGNFRATLVLIPEKNFAVILLANPSGFEYRVAAVVDSTARGVFNMLNGNPATPVAVPLLIHLAYWSLLLTPLVQIFGIVFVWKKRQGIKVLGVVLTVILNLGVVFFILSLAQMEMTLRSLLVFHPELGYVTVIAAIIGIGWSTLYTTMYLSMRNAK